MSNTSIRIKEELKQISMLFCQEEERSMSYLINKALAKYLEDWKDYKLAESGYKKHTENGSKSINIFDLAKKLDIDLK